MAWTTPKTWAVNEVLTAANMNTYLRDNTDWLGNSRPHSRSFNSAAISLTNSTTTAITMNTDRYNVGSMHSTSTNTSRITVQTGGAGTYAVTGFVQYAANATGVRQTYIRTNGVTNQAGHAHVSLTATALDVTVSTYFAAVVGDYFEITAFQSSGGALNVNAFGEGPSLAALWETV